MEEFAIFFDDGAWIVLRQDEFGNVSFKQACPSLEYAIQAVAMVTGDRVGLKLITKQQH